MNSMKKKIFLLLLALPMALQGFSQTDDSNVWNIDFEEDTTHVNSLNEIIAMQELVYAKSYRSNVIRSVWKRNSFFTLSYASTSLSGKGLMVYNKETGKMEKQDTKYKTDWGVSLKSSSAAAFHKKPIADVLSFGLEYSILDIAVNHYSKDKDMRFDSSKTFKVENENNYSGFDELHYMPWGSEMYTFAYGIHLGPSVTVAPFAKLKSPGAAHIRLHTYFTVGYRASFMWMKGDNEQDVNPREMVSERNSFETVSNSNKLSWAHGLVTTWGIRLSWKGIAVGYELINGGYNFKSLEKDIYGSDKFKFSENSQRISISYVW